MRDPSVTNSQYPVQAPYAPLPNQPVPAFDNTYNPAISGAPYGQPAPQMFQPSPITGTHKLIQETVCLHYLVLFYCLK